MSSRYLSLLALTFFVVHQTENDKHKQTLYDLLISILPSLNLVFVKSRKIAGAAKDFFFIVGLAPTSVYADRTLRRCEGIVGVQS